MVQTLPPDSPVSARETAPLAVVLDPAGGAIGIREAQVRKQTPMRSRHIATVNNPDSSMGNGWYVENAWRCHDSDDAVEHTLSEIAGGVAAMADLSSDPCLSVSGYCLRLNDNLLQYNVTLAPLPNNRARVVVQNRAFEAGGIGPWKSITTLTGEHNEAGRMFNDMLEQGALAMRRWESDGVGVIAPAALIRASDLMPQALQAYFETLRDEIVVHRLCSPRIDGIGTLAF